MSYLLIGHAENVSDFVKTSAYGECAGCNAKLDGAPLCAPMRPAYQGGESGLFGGGSIGGAASGPSRRGPYPPLLAGVSPYSPGGPNYAPAFPESAVVGAAGGCGNNCLVRSLSHLLRGDMAGAPDICTRARCASAREAIVAMYGCEPNSELELQV